MPEHRDPSSIREPLEEDFEKSRGIVARLVHAIRECPQDFPCPFCGFPDGCVTMAEKVVDAVKLQEARDADGRRHSENL